MAKKGMFDVMSGSALMHEYQIRPGDGSDRPLYRILAENRELKERLAQLEEKLDAIVARNEEVQKGKAPKRKSKDRQKGDKPKAGRRNHVQRTKG